MRYAKWIQIDFENLVWTIPAEDMKAGREHRSSTFEWRGRHSASGSFPGFSFRVRSSSLSLATNPWDTPHLWILAIDFGIDGSPHGYRSTFRSWTSDNEIPWEQGETALAHKIPGMAGPYMRSDLLELRRIVMQDYSDYIDAQIRALEAEESSEDS